MTRAAAAAVRVGPFTAPGTCVWAVLVEGRHSGGEWVWGGGDGTPVLPGPAAAPALPTMRPLRSMGCEGGQFFCGALISCRGPAANILSTMPSSRTLCAVRGLYPCDIHAAWYQDARARANPMGCGRMCKQAAGVARRLDVVRVLSSRGPGVWAGSRCGWWDGGVAPNTLLCSRGSDRLVSSHTSLVPASRCPLPVGWWCQLAPGGPTAAPLVHSPGSRHAVAPQALQAGCLCHNLVVQPVKEVGCWCPERRELTTSVWWAENGVGIPGLVPCAA
jgi:hypothetical protein